MKRHFILPLLTSVGLIGCSDKLYEYHGSCTGKEEVSMLSNFKTIAPQFEEVKQETYSLHINQKDLEVTFNNGTIASADFVKFNKYNVTAGYGEKNKIAPPGEELRYLHIDFDKQTKVLKVEQTISRGLIPKKPNVFYSSYSFTGTCKE